MFKNKSLLAVTLLGILFALLAGCSSLTGGGALGTEGNPIVFAFVPSGETANVVASADALAARLSEETGLVIKANVPTGYVGAIEAMCAGEAEIGALNTFSYIVAHERGCADVALASERFGSTVYTGQIITRADSGIASVADLKGHSFCRPEELSTSGWIIPSIMMRANGVNPDTDLTEVRDVGSHDAVVAAVYNGDCDAGSTYEDARESVQDDYPDVMDQVVQVAITDEIPNDNVAFAPGVPQDIRDKISDALIAMTQNEDDLAILNAVYEWEGLVKVDDTFYDTFRQTLEQSGVDVNSFISEE